MNLWILRPVNDLAADDDPWDPWYDKTFGFVIRASTEAKARHLANEKAGAENRGEFGGEKIANTTTPWLDPNYSTCVPLTDEGEPSVVIEDSRWA